MPEEPDYHTNVSLQHHNIIKPIQTRWNGRHYRSRLEARWAVFFDTLGLTFMYEPEGFEMPDGTRYLPDFYLPEVRWFAEVKPFARTSSKAYCFTRHGGGSVLMLDGEPYFRSYTGFTPVSVDDYPESVMQSEFSLDIWQNRGLMRDECRLFCDPDYEAVFRGVSEISDAFSIRYRAAVEAALSARFRA